MISHDLIIDHILLIHIIVQQKPTQHCKASIRRFEKCYRTTQWCKVAQNCECIKHYT